MSGKARATPPPNPDALAQRLGLQFSRPELLRQALTHRSAADPKRGQLDSNERLEFLGDRVLGLLMAEWLSELYPQEREGGLMRRFGVLVSGETLARVATGLDLGPALLIPPSESRAGVAQRQTVLADAFEALLGALYLDGGLEAARPFLRRAFEPLIRDGAMPLHQELSAKSRLQEHTLGRGQGLPDYALLSTTGPDHQPVFVVSVTAAGRRAEGTGESKRAAEQAAAEAWLAGLEAS